MNEAGWRSQAGYSLVKTVRAVMRSQEPPRLHRYGERGEKFRIAGTDIEISNIAIAARIERVFMKHKRRVAKHKQGWLHVYETTFAQWDKLPFYLSGNVFCGRTGAMLSDFQGCCVIYRDKKRGCVALETWLEGDERRWVLASINAILKELRRR